MVKPFGIEYLEMLAEARDDVELSTQTNTTTMNADHDSDVDD